MNKEIELDLEVLAILILAVENQKQMLKGKLKHNAAGFLNKSIASGKTVLSLMGFNNLENEDYYSIFTDVIHEQCDEFKKALIKKYEEPTKTSDAK